MTDPLLRCPLCQNPDFVRVRSYRSTGDLTGSPLRLQCTVCQAVSDVLAPEAPPLIYTLKIVSTPHRPSS